MTNQMDVKSEERNSEDSSQSNSLKTMKINKSAPIPLYQQILNEIRSRIASGEWPANSQLPTEAELEDVLHVSRVTIRQAFSAAVEEGLVVRLAGKGTFVSGNQIGSTVVRADGFIGYIVPHLSSSFNVQTLLGVETVLRNAGYHLIFCNSEGDLGKENQLIEDLQTNPMAGYIIQPVYSQNHARAISRIISSGGRVVFIDRDIPGVKADTVMSNHREAGQKIVRHLIDRGYKDIVYLAHEPIKLPSIAERLQGYEAAMTECGLTPRPPFLVGGTVELGYREGPQNTSLDEQRAVDKIVKLLQESNRPEAIAAMNDLVAMLVYEAAKKAGLQIPGDLGVVGFDNLECADASNITTMAQQPFEIGSEAARLLLRRIRGDREPARRILLPTQLISRGSSANH